MRKYATVSAKIDVELKKKMDELGISPSEAIRRALEQEVDRRMMELLRERIEKASVVLSKVNRDAWVKAIRESRDGR
jgi:antitoxin component of RelBE/YafQ-DinJ toxin-antitoxin module